MGVFLFLDGLFSIWQVQNFEVEIYTRRHDTCRAGQIRLQH
jgi:hypothetical protein